MDLKDKEDDDDDLDQHYENIQGIDHSLLHKGVEQWNRLDIITFLNSLGLSQYTENIQALQDNSHIHIGKCKLKDLKEKL